MIKVGDTFIRSSTITEVGQLQQSGQTFNIGGKSFRGWTFTVHTGSRSYGSCVFESSEIADAARKEIVDQLE